MVGSIGSTGSQQSMAQKMFGKLDSDGSGAVSKAEFQEMISARASETGETEDSEKTEEMFSKIDTDGNGEISETEHNTFMESMKEKPPPPPPTEMMKSMISNLGTSSSEDTQAIIDILNKKQSGEDLTDDDKAALQSFAEQVSSQYGSSGSTSSDANWKGMFINSLTA